MKLKSILLATTITIVFSGCLGGNSENQEWTSLIYPDKQNEKRSKKHGIFQTLEQCQKASKAELANLGLSNRGDYKCGLNCKYHEGMKIDVCEKLTK